MDEKARHKKALEMEYDKANDRCFKAQCKAHDAFWDMLRAKFRMDKDRPLNDPCTDKEFFEWAESEAGNDPAKGM